MRILFQGDSITDAYRAKDNDWNDGIGYPRLVGAELGFKEPDKKYEFFNRGISGNRVVDLYARIKKDIINLRPDVLSILVGVNDVWHELGTCPNGVGADRYYDVYCMLIEDVRKALPDIKIMILEPFVLKGMATEEKWNVFYCEVIKRAEKARAVADKYGLTFVPLQDGFDALCEKAPAEYWLGDGVHPSAMGHEYIKREWLKAFYGMRG